jgi:hypothetical protein
MTSSLKKGDILKFPPPPALSPEDKNGSSFQNFFLLKRVLEGKSRIPLSPIANSPITYCIFHCGIVIRLKKRKQKEDL